MKRREFISLMGGAAVFPLTAHAQQGVRRIVVLMAFVEDDPVLSIFIATFREGLRKLGWVEGRNLRLDVLVAPAGEEQRIAQEIIASKPDLIVTQNTPTTIALRQRTRTIPIVFANVSDPVGEGFVAGLARPGGNLTGFIDAESAMGGKWLELLKEIAPGIKRVALPFNPASSPGRGAYYLGSFKAAAAALGVEAMPVPVRDSAELQAVVAALAGAANGGLLGTPDSFLRNRREELTALTARHRVPAVYPSRYYSLGGGLMSYGSDTLDNWRGAAIYADRILKGEKPGELPVQVPVKFELVINLKTAKALGLDVPWILQQRADEVIE